MVISGIICLLMLGFLFYSLVAGILVVVRTKENHIFPMDLLYNSGFNTTTKCVDCGRVGLYDNQHPANCCEKCGGDIRNDGSKTFKKRDGLYQWLNREEYKKLIRGE